MNRDLDGMYFRVKRDGKYDSICITDLEYDELEEILKGRDNPWYEMVFDYLVDIYGNLMLTVHEEEYCEDNIVALVGFLDKYATPKDKVIEIVGVIQSFAEEYNIVGEWWYEDFNTG